MTVDEMINDVELCRERLARIEDELNTLLQRSDIAIKSSLFGAATQSRAAMHMTRSLLESLAVYRQIEQQLGASPYVRRKVPDEET